MSSANRMKENQSPFHENGLRSKKVSLKYLFLENVSETRTGKGFIAVLTKMVQAEIGDRN